MNKKTVIAVFVIAIIVSGYYLLFSGRNTKENQTTWVNYTSQEQNFSVLFPNYPTVSSSKSGTANFYSWEVMIDQFSFAVYKNVYLVELDVTEPNKLLKIFLNIVISSIEGTLISSEGLYHKGYPAIEFTVKAGGKMSKGRVILVNKTTYGVLMLYPPENYDAEKYEHFIESFEVK